MAPSIQISHKRKLSCFTTKAMVNVCNGCDVHMFFVEEVIEAVSFIAKMWPKKIKIKGTVHPKMKIMSSFTHPQVFPNLYECVCPEHRGRYSEECGKQSSSGAPLTSIVFVFPLWKSMVPKTVWLQSFFKISFFVLRHSYKWNYLWVSK